MIVLSLSLWLTEPVSRLMGVVSEGLEPQCDGHLGWLIVEWMDANSVINCISQVQASIWVDGRFSPKTEHTDEGSGIIFFYTKIYVTAIIEVQWINIDI